MDVCEFKTKMNSLSEKDQTAFMLANFKWLLAQSRVPPRRKVVFLETPPKKPSETHCDCEDPDIVYVESCHDNVCRNCGIAHHMASEPMGNVKHFEELSHICVASDRVYYKRENHFKRLLRDFQGGRVKVPQDVLETLRIEAQRPYTAKSIKEVLKYYQWVRFYNQANYLAQKLGGDIQRPYLSSEDVRCFLLRFRQYSFAFDDLKRDQKSSRSNFLSYNLVFYNLCKELDYPFLLKYIELPKGRRTVLNQNKVWDELKARLPKSRRHSRGVRKVVR